jgi:hypothetical protein
LKAKEAARLQIAQILFSNNSDTTTRFICIFYIYRLLNITKDIISKQTIPDKKERERYRMYQEEDILQRLFFITV